ncbi:hypothetical protein Gotur_007845 [Gossypium turneri]
MDFCLEDRSNNWCFLSLLTCLLGFVLARSPSLQKYKLFALLFNCIDLSAYLFTYASVSEVFANSPFFISAEDASMLEMRKNDEYKEITVPAGKSYEVCS